MQKSLAFSLCTAMLLRLLYHRLLKESNQQQHYGLHYLLKPLVCQSKLVFLFTAF